MPYRLLADLVLTVHFGIVAFVVGGLVLVVVGNLRGWRFVNGWWFRLAHVAAIAVVVAQAWLGVACPLTTLESALRENAGEAGYETSFIEHWLTAILFDEAPPFVDVQGGIDPSAASAIGRMFTVTLAKRWW